MKRSGILSTQEPSANVFRILDGFMSLLLADEISSSVLLSAFLVVDQPQARRASHYHLNNKSDRPRTIYAFAKGATDAPQQSEDDGVRQGEIEDSGVPGRPDEDVTAQGELCRRLETCEKATRTPEDDRRAGRGVTRDDPAVWTLEVTLKVTLEDLPKEVPLMNLTPPQGSWIL
ncbi:hypothetical protein P3T76_003388 [Phytophthora citrophthora]|uniref:Uncharacterized protein n=1 Tax=Phytophthora citrophthora TaxID=4793 RepID=A0AAD9LPL2_9STRA|nr:hypothetical protein P3T76_003388 [Phytophthora citrophthora]